MTKFIELKPNGRKIYITEGNKKEYLELRVNWMCYGATRAQLESFKAGFYEVVPQYMIKPFTAKELEEVICGCETIDLDDWKSYTLYVEPYQENHKVIIWFWKLLKEYNQKELSNILKFCTGTKRLSIQGFKGL